MGDTRLFWPQTPPKITEGFGWSAWRNGVHDGIDMAFPQGTPLRATTSGRVLRHYTDQWGAGIDIVSPTGLIARHWHLSRFDVDNGQQVDAGQVIGLSGGAKGTWGAGFSTGPHLHWGTRVGGQWVDPQSLNPVSFDELDKKPQPQKRKKKMGAFYRSPDGSIFWQEKPNTVLIPLSLPTWIAYAANGNAYADLSAKDIDSLKKKYGTAPVPPAGGGGGTVNVPDFKISMTGEAVKK
jgi:murein DD-endopeptidase MepM/ murein hydrolase activator NlpD